MVRFKAELLMKRWLSILFKIAVSFSLLFLLFRETDIDKFSLLLRSMDIRFLGTGILLYAGLQIIATYRWSLLLPKGVISVPFRRLVGLYYIGLFFNNLLPTAIGGDFVKAYYLYKDSGEGERALASIFMDRYSGFFSLVFISLLALLFGYSKLSSTIIPVLVLGFGLFFISVSLFIWIEALHAWLLRRTGRIGVLKINERVDSLYNAFMIYKENPRVILKAFALSFLIQLIGIFVVFVISLGYSMTVPIGYFYLFVPLAITISMIPVSVAGIGLREGAFVFLFSRVGLDTTEALGLSLTWFLIIVLVGLYGGFEYTRIGPAVKK